MGKKIVIQNRRFGMPYYGMVMDKKLQIPAILLLQYHSDKHKLFVGIHDLDDNRSKALDGRTIRLDDASAVISEGRAELSVPLYKHEFTLSVLGRFYKLIPQSDDPGAVKAEKLFNRLGRPICSHKEFYGTCMDAMRTLSELKSIWG